MKIKRTERTGRSKSAKEWIYGLNPVLEALRAGRSIKSIRISSGKHDSPRVHEIQKEAEKRSISLVKADIGFFHSRFPKGHQGIAAEVLPKTYTNIEELLKIPLQKDEPPLFIILDGVEDPRNFGAIVRVADATGIHGIIIQSYRSVTLGSEVAKASSGAVEYVPVSMVANIKNIIREMKVRGITVIGAETGVKKSFWDADLTVPLALVVGSEGRGLRRTVKDSCDFLISIPMKGKVNSLNVSTAVGILAFEVSRQRFRKN